MSRSEAGITIYRIHGQMDKENEMVETFEEMVRRTNDDFDFGTLIYWGYESGGDLDEAMRLMHDLSGVETNVLLPSTVEKIRDIWSKEFGE